MTKDFCSLCSKMLRRDNTSGVCGHCQRTKCACVVCLEAYPFDLGSGRTCEKCRKTMEQIIDAHKNDDDHSIHHKERRQKLPQLEQRASSGIPLFG